MGDMGGGGVKNLKKVRDVLCEQPLFLNKILKIVDKRTYKNFVMN